MSVENAKAFFEAVEEDKALQAKLKGVSIKLKDDRDQAIAELIKIASLERFEFTADDYAEFRTQHRNSAGHELKNVTPERTCLAAWVWLDAEGCR